MARRWKSVRAEAAAAGRIDEERVADEAARMRSAEQVGLIGHRVHGEEFEDARHIFATDQDSTLTEE